jgi:hypothetical protein
MIDGNKREQTPKVMHIVGNSYAELARLAQVLIFEEFLLLALTSPQTLTKVSWALGQGLSAIHYKCIEALKSQHADLVLVSNCHLPNAKVLSDIPWVTNVVPISQYHYQAVLSLPKNHSAHKSLTVAMSDLVQAGQQFLQGMLDHVVQQSCHLLIRNVSGRMIHRIFPIQVDMECTLGQFQKSGEGLQIKAAICYYQNGELVTTIDVCVIIHNVKKHISVDKPIAEKTLKSCEKWWTNDG